MFPQLRKQIALAICPELAALPESGPVPGFRSVRIAHQPDARPESGLTSPAARIAAFRRSIGMSQRGFADVFGVTRRVISYVETGQRHPSRVLLIAMSKNFKLSTDWVLTGTGPSPFPPRPCSVPPHPNR